MLSITHRLSALILAFSLHCSLAVSPVMASEQQATEEERIFFQKNTHQVVSLEPTRITHKALKSVSNATLYRVKMTIGEISQMEKVLKQGERLILVSQPGTSRDFPEMLEILKPDFKLNSEGSGYMLQAALDVLFPISTNFDETDANLKSFTKVGNKWFFIRGAFFEDLRGYIFSVTDDGSIQSVEYNLTIPKSAVN